MAKFLPILIKILSAVPWGKVIKFVLKNFGEKEDVKKAVIEEMPENLPTISWMKIAEKELGIKEVSGRRNNPEVVKFHKSTSLNSTQDSVPWCSSFVCWVMEKSGHASTRSARARSWEEWGNAIEPFEGAIVVLWRGSPTARTGHVGFYMGDDPKDERKILILGGNQSDEVNISSYSKDRVLSYRWPV